MTQRTRIAAIRYNAAQAAYEASVTLYEAGRVYTYPVSLSSAPVLEFEETEQQLKELAVARHEGGETMLRSRRPREEMHGLEDLPAIVHQATTTLWDKLRRRAA